MKSYLLNLLAIVVIVSYMVIYKVMVMALMLLSASACGMLGDPSGKTCFCLFDSVAVTHVAV